MDHYARRRTWIAGNFNPALKERQNTPMHFSPEQLESFKDPGVYLKYRKDLEGGFFRNFDSQLKDSEATKNTIKNFTDAMKKRLAGKPELLENLVPGMLLA